MKKLNLIWLMLLTIYCVGNVFAQKKDEKPNFSGTWILDTQKSSNINPIICGFDHNNKSLQCSSKLLIIHSLSKLTLSEIMECKSTNELHQKPIIIEFESSFFIDGRGEENGVSESKTKVRGNEIFIIFFSTDVSKGKKTELLNSELSLSKNGKILTIKLNVPSTFVRSNISDISNPIISVLIYNRSN